MSGVGLAQPDITLHLDENGVIRDASASGGMAGEAVLPLVGREWRETVASGGGEKVRQMLDGARFRGVSVFSRVVQCFPSGRELPIEYTALRAPGERGGIVALGRNMQTVTELQSRLLAAQQASEREYWKLRDIETRYRLLFDASTEAVLMIGADDLCIAEANPAAIRALGVAPGWDFSSAIPAREREAFAGMLQRVREHGRAPGIVLHMGAAMAPWAVRASLMPTEPSLRYLLHFAPAGGGPAQSPAEELPVDDLIDRLPDGFVIASADGAVLSANQAFLDLTQAGTLGAVRGERLSRWLSEPGADASVLMAKLQRHQAVRLFQTTLRGELGTETKVEISAACSGQGTIGFCGILLRDIGRRLDGGPSLETMMDGFTRQLGRESLLEIVRSAADVVERHLIKEALDRVGGNRTAAADLLGVSRQSLHTKLNRHAALSFEDSERLTSGD